MFRVILLLFLLLLGCENLFTTRPVEAPTGVQYDNQVDLFEPESVFEHFKFSFNQRNPDMYLRMMTSDSLDKFVYQADEYSVSTRPVFSQWSYQKESDFIINLFAVLPFDSLANISFQVLNSSIQTDHADFYFSYQFQIHHTIKKIPTHVKGFSEIYLKRNLNDIWKITYWRDERLKSGVSNWSDIKAEF